MRWEKNLLGKNTLPPLIRGSMGRRVDFDTLAKKITEAKLYHIDSEQYRLPWKKRKRPVPAIIN
jgi:hypothetical protein